MKRIFIVLITCLLTSIAFAQKITDKDLQGTWKLAAFSTEGIYMDMISGTVTLSEELKAELTPNLLKQLNENLKQAIEVLKSSNTNFSGNTIKQNRKGDEKSGTFIIKDINNKQQILITFNDSSSSTHEIAIKDEKLYLKEFDQREFIDYIYIRK